jgi:hypothetical protein
MNKFIKMLKKKYPVKICTVCLSILTRYCWSSYFVLAKGGGGGISMLGSVAVGRGSPSLTTKLFSAKKYYTNYKCLLDIQIHSEVGRDE